MATPHTCPVCNGKGTVQQTWGDIYLDTNVICHACSGIGVEWGTSTSITQTCSKWAAESMITSNGMCQECSAALGMGG